MELLQLLRDSELELLIFDSLEYSQRVGAYISRRCVDVLQPDITWIGGITEAKRVVAMAAAYDILVVPHGSSVYSYHLQVLPLHSLAAI